MNEQTEQKEPTQAERIYKVLTDTFSPVFLGGLIFIATSEVLGFAIGITILTFDLYMRYKR